MDKIKVQLREVSTTTKKFELDYGCLKKVCEVTNEPKYSIILSEIRDGIMNLYTAHMIIPFDHIDDFIKHIDYIANDYEDHFYVPKSWSNESVSIYMSTNYDCYMIEIIDVHYPTSHRNYIKTIKVSIEEMDRVITQINNYVRAVEAMEDENNG